MRRELYAALQCLFVSQEHYKFVTDRFCKVQIWGNIVGPNLLWAEMSNFPAASANTIKQVQPLPVVIRPPCGTTGHIGHQINPCVLF